MIHGSLNGPIEHHPTIGYMVYNGYYKVMSNIPKMGQLPTPVIYSTNKYDPGIKMGASMRQLPEELPAHVPSAARRDTAPCSPEKICGFI